MGCVKSTVRPEPQEPPEKPLETSHCSSLTSCSYQSGMDEITLRVPEFIVRHNVIYATTKTQVVKIADVEEGTITPVYHYKLMAGYK